MEKSWVARRVNAAVGATRSTYPSLLKNTWGSDMRIRQMTGDERRTVAFHEAGHVAMVYWRCESLHARKVVLHTDRYGGSTLIPIYEQTELALMILLGGPMAELLAMDIVPKLPIRFPNEYQDANSDSTRIRNLVRTLRGGKDDRRYQFEVQERCREIIQETRMWQAVTMIAERLIADGEISGEDSEEIFEQCKAPRLYGERSR